MSTHRSHGILPKEISYSILHDVVLGLCYLHSQIPPTIHRDLSSNNVLLTSNMTAKISDLGVARNLNLTPLQVSRLTQTPGTLAYMPPEVMALNSKSDTSVESLKNKSTTFQVCEYHRRDYPLSLQAFTLTNQQFLPH